MKALVHGNRVCQIEAAEFPVAPPFSWVECGPEVTTHYTYDGNAFIPPRPSMFHSWNGSEWVVEPQNAQAAADAAALAARMAADGDEAAQARQDAQIQSDLNMTPAEVNAAVDTIFSGFTAPQRAFLKRLVRMVLAAARRVLRWQGGDRWPTGT